VPFERYELGYLLGMVYEARADNSFATKIKENQYVWKTRRE